MPQISRKCAFRENTDFVRGLGKTMRIFPSPGNEPLDGHDPAPLGRFDRSELEIEDPKKESLPQVLICFRKMFSNHISYLFDISGWRSSAQPANGK
jgi:hypothetical protein